MAGCMEAGQPCSKGPFSHFPTEGSDNLQSSLRSQVVKHLKDVMKNFAGKISVRDGLENKTTSKFFLFLFPFAMTAQQRQIKHVGCVLQSAGFVS